MTISSLKRDQILAGHLIHRCMKTTISLETEVSYTKVSQIINDFEKGVERIQKSYDSSQRYILQPCHLDVILHYLLRYPSATLNEILCELDLPSVHPSTLSRFLNRNKVKVFVALKKKLLNDDDKLLRLNFSLFYSYVNIELSKLFICTDECMIYNLQSRKLIRTDEDHNPQDPIFYNTEDKYKVKVNIYGYVTYDNFEIIMISSKFTRKDFFDLLINQRKLDHMISQVPVGARMPFFLQDNSPVHEFPINETEEPVTNPSNITIRRAVEIRNCEYVELPAFSPDLNILENLWALLKKKVRKMLPNVMISTSRQLFDLTNMCKAEISQDTIRSLFHQIPSRISIVKELRGAPSPK